MTLLPNLPGAFEGAHLNTLVANLSEGVLTLTKEGAFHYANRAALAMHGAETLTDLGGGAAGYRERFKLVDLEGVPLPSGGYPVDRLLRGEGLEGLEVNVFTNAPTDDPAKGTDGAQSSPKDEGERGWVHRYRGVPPSEDQPYATLFVQDVTAKHDAERRFERAFSSNPAPALISRLSDLRYIRADKSFLEMTGFKREEVVGRTAYEFDAFAGAKDREGLLKRFHNGDTIKPAESYLSTQSGNKKFVIVGGQPLEINDEPCMLLTFVDIDERKRMENSLRQSEERFSKTFNAAPVAAALSFLDEDRFLDVNRAFRKLTGYGDEEVMGRTGAELELWSKESEEVMATAIGQRRSYRDVEIMLGTKEGDERTVQVSAETLMIDERACVLRMFHDVSSWKRTEAELVDAIDQVMTDPSWFSASVAQKIMNARGKVSSEAKVKLAGLTKREQQTFTLSARGLDNDAVAQELGVAKNTVRNYVASLYKKLGVHSRAELMVWAKRNGVTS